MSDKRRLLSNEEIKKRISDHEAKENESLTNEEIIEKRAKIKDRLKGDEAVDSIGMAAKNLELAGEAMRSAFVQIDNVIELLKDHPDYSSFIEIKSRLDKAVKDGDEEAARTVLNELNKKIK